MPGTRYIITTIEPSSNVGMNSAPRYGATVREAANTTAAKPAAASGKRSARRSTGAYTAAALRISHVSFSATRFRKTYEVNTGMTTRAITSDAAKANRTVIAIGR